MAATEISFAKSFLSLLDTKPTKITPDHVEDPRGYPATTPYILPRLPSQPRLLPPKTRPRNATSSNNTTNPVPESSPSGTATATATATVIVRTLRNNPPLDLRLARQPLATTSALDIKNAAASRTGIPVGRLRLLYGKKPVVDSKVLKDLVSSGNGNGGGEEEEMVMEFSVMVMGGAAAAVPKKVEQEEEKKKKVEAQQMTGGGGEAILKTDEFWSDLEGFLQQRVKDEKVASVAAGRFRKAWEGEGEGGV